MEESIDRIVEKIDRYQEKKISAKRLISDLYHNEDLSMREVLNICKISLGNNYDEDMFLDIAGHIKMLELPVGGYINEDGIAVIYDYEDSLI